MPPLLLPVSPLLLPVVARRVQRVLLQLAVLWLVLLRAAVARLVLLQQGTFRPPSSVGSSPPLQEQAVVRCLCWRQQQPLTQHSSRASSSNPQLQACSNSSSSRGNDSILQGQAYSRHSNSSSSGCSSRDLQGQACSCSKGGCSNETCPWLAGVRGQQPTLEQGATAPDRLLPPQPACSPSSATHSSNV